jgi:hypothetical protein
MRPIKVGQPNVRVADSVGESNHSYFDRWYFPRFQQEFSAPAGGIRRTCRRYSTRPGKRCGKFLQRGPGTHLIIPCPLDEWKPVQGRAAFPASDPRIGRGEYPRTTLQGAPNSSNGRDRKSGHFPFPALSREKSLHHSVIMVQARQIPPMLRGEARQIPPRSPVTGLFGSSGSAFLFCFVTDYGRYLPRPCR